MAYVTSAKLALTTKSHKMGFISDDGIFFYVCSFSNHVLELEPSFNTTIYHMSQIAAGCFNQNSTFKDVHQVNFVFNGKKVSVKKEENATPQMIYNRWSKAPYLE